MIRFILSIFIIFLSAKAYADANFNVPDTCTDGVTGIGGSADGDLPVLWVSYNTGAQTVTVNTPIGVKVDDSKNWSDVVTFPKSNETYLLVSTYSPFLQSYDTIAIGSTLTKTVNLPAPGYINGHGAKLYSEYKITITDDGTPVANGFMEMAPEFPGSGPYLAELDGSGKVTIYCYTSQSLGNPATIFDSEGQYLFDTVVKTTTDDELLQGKNGAVVGNGRNGAISRDGQ
jgi:hypothetical protein